MGQIIDLKIGYKEQCLRNTLRERNRLIEMGVEEISESTFLEMIKELGYKLDNSCCFNYYNNLNDIHYYARSLSYTNTKTKRSAFHYEESFSNPEQLEALQKIRLNYFVFKSNRIWEL